MLNSEKIKMKNSQMKLYFLFVPGIILFLSVFSVKAQSTIEKNGFDLSNSSVSPDKIIDKGPSRESIPSIDDPGFLKPSKVDFLQPSDRVLGVTYNYISKAYPIKILNWHEVVNDYFGDKPVIITYSPLCGSGMAFDAHIGEEDRNFGVSGLIYNNDILLYDRESETLWSQIDKKAISGPLKGTEMEYVQTTHTTWKKWKEMYPYSQVLSNETEYTMDYNENPYGAYEQQNQVVFPLEHKDDRYHPKTWTLGIEAEGKFKAYPFEELRKTKGSIHDTFAGKEFVIRFNDNEHFVKIENADKKEYLSVVMFWFAWVAFHPETEVYTHGER